MPETQEELCPFCKNDVTNKDQCMDCKALRFNPEKHDPEKLSRFEKQVQWVAAKSKAIR